MHQPLPCRFGSEGLHAPPISVAVATVPRACRLHRTRKVRNFTPAGAIYVGRPTIWLNPFEGRRTFGHARGVIFFRHWLDGDLTPYILRRARFSEAEIGALSRRRERLLRNLPRLHGRNLQCWCPLTSPWCHADVLLDRARKPQ